jgi:hypothetical protein
MQLPYVQATGFTLVKEIGAFRIRGGLSIALARPGSVSSTAVIFIARDRLSPSQGDKIQSITRLAKNSAQNSRFLRPGCTFFTIEVAGRCVELIFHDASIGKFRADQYGAVPAPWTAVDRDTAVVAVAAQCGSVFEEGRSIPELIRVAKRVVMEILGFGLQSETQYLEDFLRVIAERKQSGNTFPPCFLSVPALLPLTAVIVSIAETKRQQVSTSETSNLNVTKKLMRLALTQWRFAGMSALFRRCSSGAAASLPLVGAIRQRG